MAISVVRYQQGEQGCAAPFVGLTASIGVAPPLAMKPRSRHQYRTPVVVPRDETGATRQSKTHNDRPRAVPAADSASTAAVAQPALSTSRKAPSAYRGQQTPAVSRQQGGHQANGGTSGASNSSARGRATSAPARARGSRVRPSGSATRQSSFYERQLAWKQRVEQQVRCPAPDLMSCACSH